MKPVENVHIRINRYELKKYNAEKREYCFDNFAGVAETVEIIHPDFAVEDAIQYGEYLRKLRIAKHRKAKRLETRTEEI